MSYETLEGAVQTLVTTNSALVAAVTGTQQEATSAITRAEQAATIATANAGEAYSSAVDAAGSQVAAEQAATIAATKADEASSSAVDAASQAGLADGSEAAAKQAATIATTKADEAEQSAQAAAQSASEAEQTLIDKVSKSDIVQTTGQMTEKVMSQKAVTEMFSNLIPWVGSTIPSIGTVFDFEKNRYAVKGVPAGLSDISEFIRLSSATDWQNGKLVEKQNNMPRISSAGLLIEKSATELIPDNSTITSTNTEWVATSKPDTQVGNSFEFVSDGSAASVRNDIPTYPNGSVTPNSGYYYRSILAKKASADSFLLLGSVSPNASIIVNLKNGSLEYEGSLVVESKISDINEYYLIETLSTESGSTTRQFSLFASNNRGSGSLLAAPSIGHKVTIALPSFMDTADFPQSFVKTSGTKVTRSPDILNIPLLSTQTITGDWDEGVTYEVADNIATFTGHGYIRNITVEAL